MSRTKAEQTTVHCVVESTAKAKRLFEQMLPPSMNPPHYFESILHQGGWPDSFLLVFLSSGKISFRSIQVGSSGRSAVHHHTL